MNPEYGTIYWINPITQDLEFMMAMPQGVSRLGFFHNFERSFMGQISQEKIENMSSPDYKIKEKFNFFHMPYHPDLIKALNGLRDYLNHCQSIDGLCATNESYSNYTMMTTEQIKAISPWELNQQITRDNFNKAIDHLIMIHGPINEKYIKSGQTLFKVLLNYKNKKNAGKNDPKYLTELEKLHGDYLSSLKPQYQEAVSFYTANGYYEMNQYLRGEIQESDAGNIANLKKQINNLNQVLANAPPITKTLTVYRGLRFDDQQNFYNIKPGQIIDLFRDSFTSTSFKMDVSASNYFTQTQCCIFILTLPPGTKGLYVGKQSSVSHEDELILAPGPYFRVYKYPHESVPAKGLYPAKPDMRFYRLMCVNCPEAYSQYQNKVYQQLVGPGITIADFPEDLVEASPIVMTHQSAEKKITTKKVKLLPKYDIIAESHLLLKHSKIDHSSAKISQMPVGYSYGKLYKEDEGETYEGEIFEGVPHGQGKSVFDNGNKFEGKYENGQMSDGKLIYEPSSYGQNVMYEGKISGGSPHGFGKMTNKDGSIYEGTFSYGQKHGKGKLTDKNGEIITASNWSYDKPSGKGTWMDKEGNLYDVYFGYKGGMEQIIPAKHTQGTKYLPEMKGTYIGALYGPEPHGSGRLSYESGDLYMGNFLDGKPSGKGEFTKNGKIVYKGEYKDGKYEGYGHLTTNIGIYDGNFKDGKMNGYGTYKYSNGELYNGNFLNDKYDGKGILKNTLGDVYTGEFKNGQKDGDGGIVFKNKDVYLGQFHHNAINGTGKMIYHDGKEYSGQWKNDEPSGMGEMKYPDGSIYKGVFEYGVTKGMGLEQLKNGKLFKVEYVGGVAVHKNEVKITHGKLKSAYMDYNGELIDNVPWGIGTAIYTDDKNKFVGKFWNGVEYGDGQMYYNDGLILDGHWINGKLNGEYTLTYPNGDKAKCTFVDGKMMATTAKKTPPFAELHIQDDGVKSVYHGDLINGQPSGQGEMNFDNGSKYIGQFKDGDFNGTGKYISKTGNVYTGTFDKDMYNGQGTLVDTDMGTYVGEFKDDEFNGMGKLTTPNGDIYEGPFSKNKPVDYSCDLKYKNGDKYKGEFEKLLSEGEGTLTYKNGEYYSGTFSKGKPNGYGELHDKNGKVIYNGSWKDGEKDGDAIITNPDGSVSVFEYKNGIATKKKPVAKNVGYGVNYYGQLYQDQLYGEGTFIGAAGDVYTANCWKAGSLHGKYIHTLPDGKQYNEDQSSIYGLNYGISIPKTLIPNGKTTLPSENQTYVGFVLKGKPNGQGKVTYKDGSSYEGEWLNGLKNGTGKWTSATGQVSDVTFVNDVKQDPNISSIQTLNLIDGKYEGETLLGKPNGKGNMTYKTGIIYEGEFKDGVPHGKGKMTYKIGTIYEGEFKDGLPHGAGKLVLSGRTLIGKWINGLMNGPGKMINDINHITYDGEFKNNDYHGLGVLKDEISTYAGHFTNDQKNGKGVLEIYGMKLEGNWTKDKLNGPGTVTKKDGTVLKTTFKSLDIGQYFGDLNGNTVQPDGMGTLLFNDWMYYNEGDIYEGQFENGTPNGHGKLIDGSDESIFEGEFVNGSKIGGILTEKNGIKHHIIYEPSGAIASKTLVPVTIKLPMGTYTGEVINGVPNGTGKLEFAWSGGVYTGQFKDGKPHGSGILITSDGSKHDVIYTNGKMTSDKLVSPMPVSSSTPASIPIIEASVSSPIILVSSHFEEKHLKKLNITPEILAVLHMWAVDCPKNKFKSPKTGKCVTIDAKTAKKIIDDLLIPPTIPNIDPIHLKGLSIGVLIQLAELAKDCPHNKFKSPLKHNCIVIDGKTGKKILKELQDKLDAPFVSK